MAHKQSLRYRIAISFAAFGGLASLMLAVGVYLAAYNLERHLIDDTLRAELQDYIARRLRNPHSPPAATATIRSYVIPHSGGAPDIPPAVRKMTPGRHHLLLDGVSYRAAVVDANGERFAVLYNETHLRRRDRGFVVLLVGSVLLMILLSAGAGFWLAGKVIAPVTDLVRRVADRRPEDAPEPLASDFPWDEVGSLARDFDDYLERLRAFIERERAFTGDVSHELRTPLTVIKGATEVLLSDNQLTPAARARVERILRSTEEMVALIDVLLALAREEGMRPANSQAECVVGDVLNDVVERYRDLYRARPLEVTLEVKACPRVAVQRAELAIVLGNLVRNAFAYTEQGLVRIVVEREAVSVQDTGIGIEAAALPRVFERHYRGGRSEGAGIGLSLVKRICQRHGWEIDIDSESGRGTVTRLRFS